MVQPRSLVVLGSSVSALAVVRNAHALGLPTVLYDTRFDVATCTRLAEVRVEAGAGPEQSLNSLIEIGTRDAPAALIATGDAWLRFLSRYREELDRAFGLILHPANASLEVCLGKARFARWCADNAIPSPAWYDPEQLLRGDVSANFPLFVRPANSLHSLASSLPKALEVANAADLRAWLDRFRAADVEPIVTESLLGQRVEQISVGAARAHGRIMSFVARKLRPLPENCAVGTYVELHPDAQAQQIAHKVLDALDYFGIAELEILRSLDTGRYFVIEVNARPWIQYGLGTASGHDLLAFVLEPESAMRAVPVVSGRRWIHFGSDFYACFNGSSGFVRRGKLGAWRYAQTLIGANTFALFDWSDPQPFWRELKRTLALVAGRAD